MNFFQKGKLHHFLLERVFVPIMQEVGVSAERMLNLCKVKATFHRQ